MKRLMKYEIYDGDTLVDSGSARELADRFAVTVDAIHQSTVRNSHLLWRYTVKRAGMTYYPDDLDRRIKADYEKGYDRECIAARLNMGYSTVCKRITRMVKGGEMTL